ncbi:MAG: hypothetical protein M0D54_13795 [Hyphomonadaceae bacterium JAD_PAG50586_4]|nr:MAG: hypothetical protein M0D54_13795 [Hyphomonadaceae bacterium JAD_PAG50586_4]
MTSKWPRGWFAIEDPEHKRVFAEELDSEVGFGHPLKDVTAVPIARADGRDDYLFQLSNDRVAEVHLTFANRPERPPWPVAAVFENLAAWRKTIEE